MTQQSTVPQAHDQLFKAGENFCWLPDNWSNPSVFIDLTRFQCTKKVIYGLLVISGLTAGQVRAQSPEILSGYPGHVSLSVPAVITERIQDQKQLISDGIELFPLISVFGKPVSEPGANTKSTNRPDERNEGRVGVEQNNKLTPDGTHKFWRLLLTQLSAFAAAFSVGIYLSMRANIRRDWRQHIPKGRLPKVPAVAMLSMFCIPRKIRPFRWRLWEQRSWFLDMKIRHGFEVAYRDAWYWKKLVAERW